MNDLEFALEHLGDAAFVQLVRDPWDIVASSYAFQNKQPAAWQEASFETRLSHLDDFFRRTSGLLAGRSTLVLRYEEFVTDVEAWTSALFEFLGLSVPEETRSFLRQEANELFSRQGTSATPAASIGRWKTDLSPDQQRAAREILGEQLRELGYPD